MCVLFCDSNCELWHTTAEELGLNVIKMPYFIEDTEYYYDLGKNTDFKMFYSKIREGKIPKTSALNEFDYIDYFEPVLKEGKDILYLTFSHMLSGTFNSMDKAIDTLSKKYPDRKIDTFDTKSISLGCGIQVYYAAKLWNEGKSSKEIIDFLTKFSSEIVTYFCVDSLQHLKRGGRITGAQAAIGTILGVKPLLKIIDNGSIISVSKIKGSKRVISELAQLVKDKGTELDKYIVFILQADCEEQGEELKKKIIELCGDNVTVIPQLVGPVIASHCGPGTLGVIFHSDKR
jgi:DegV family protein with EDD domain